MMWILRCVNGHVCKQWRADIQSVDFARCFLFYRSVPLNYVVMQCHLGQRFPAILAGQNPSPQNFFLVSRTPAQTYLIHFYWIEYRLTDTSIQHRTKNIPYIYIPLVWFYTAASRCVSCVPVLSFSLRHCLRITLPILRCLMQNNMFRPKLVIIRLVSYRALKSLYNVLCKY